MRYALISDVHANLPALEGVLADIAARPDVAITYHLGDLVGYAPWPNETVQRILDAKIAGVAGNYDSTVGLDYKHCGCKYEDSKQEELAHLSFQWTKEHVSPDVKRLLASLPFRIDLRPLGGHTSGPTVILVHGAPTLNTLYLTEDRPDTFFSRMAEIAGAKTGDVLCFGHTHLPWHRTIEGIHFLNTGSVGRPKDGDWRAGYVILDIDKSGVELEFVRVEYEVDATVQAIRASELPDDFADHLLAGATVKNLPIACTLSSEAYAERMAWIAKLNRSHLRTHRQTRGALELSYDPEAEALVRELVRRERDCCAFLDFSFAESSSAFELRIGVSESSIAEAELLLSPFLEGTSSR